MKRILEVCLSPDLGGLELFMKNSTKFLKCSAVINKKGKLINSFIEEKIPFIEIGRYNFFKLAKIFDKENIDIVHIHWTKDIPTVVLAKLISKKKPKIVQTRNMHMTRFKSDFYHRFLYKNIDMIVGVTNMVTEQLKKFIPSDISPKITKCYMGAITPKKLSILEINDIKKSLNLNNEFIVSIVGRVEEDKGQHIVLEAVEKLRKNGLNIRVLVVGHYMDKKYFDNLKLKYPSAIFTGFKPNPMDYMQISDCFVLATKKETFGLVLIEAMKSGVCVLASRSGGPLEIIDDEKNGLLFQPMNSDDLSTKLTLIYNNPELKINLALNGQNKANKYFDNKLQFEELKKILEEI